MTPEWHKMMNKAYQIQDAVNPSGIANTFIEACQLAKELEGMSSHAMVFSRAWAPARLILHKLNSLLATDSLRYVTEGVFDDMSLARQVSQGTTF